MELEDLKNEWQHLDRRLDHLEKRMGDMTAEVAAGSFRSSADRLQRHFRLGIVLCLLLPLNFWSILDRHGEHDSRALMAYITLFALVALVRQIQASKRLRRIDPTRQSLREAGAAAVRFRRFFLRSVCICFPLAVGLLLWLGIWMRAEGCEYLLYGFVAGLLFGIPVGVVRFRQICREIDTLQAALEHLEA